MNKHAPESKPSKLKWLTGGLKTILVVTQTVVSMMLIVSLVQTGIITGWVLGVIIVGIVALLALSAIGLLVCRKTSLTVQIICVIVALACVVIGCFALSYTGAFNGFLAKVTEQRPEMKQYGVLVLNDSEIQDVKGLTDRSVGFLKADPKAANAEQKLAETVQIDADFYDDIDTLLETLDSKISEAIVLETDRIEMLKEGTEDLAGDTTEVGSGSIIQETRIIYTFEIEVESETAEVPDKKVTTEPFVIYISGSDSRDGVKATARSDVNIVVAVNPKDAKILLVSIPRDTYVQLHGTTGIKDKLTHAGVYGIEMSKATIEDFLGINIDHTVKVSFDTVVKVVDELDGIDIYSDTAMRLGAMHGKTCEYVVGTQHVDGDCALRFARERKTYETGDRHRGENQQAVITAIINKLSSSRDYILKLPAILDIAADSFETSLDRSEITNFIRFQLQEQPKWQVKSIAVNGTGAMLPTYSMGSNLPLYVMIPYGSTVDEAKSQIDSYLKPATSDDSVTEEKQE